VISVCIPAHNEEKNIRACLDSIKASAAHAGCDVEIVVALNRCTDRTEEIARSYGAKIVREDAKNLSKIRNVAVKSGQGDMVVTIDADSAMSLNALSKIKAALESGRTVGGGVMIIPERLSLGILFTGLVITFYLIFVLRDWITGGMFWFNRADFDKIGGFNEDMLSAEDIDFAKRLKAWGKRDGRPFTNLFSVKMKTSCRKFDLFGDWYLIRNPRKALRMLSGRDVEAANELWYDVKR
jgi:glycosyltransferase involved in cell wall biosynthesis